VQNCRILCVWNTPGWSQAEIGPSGLKNKVKSSGSRHSRIDR